MIVSQARRKRRKLRRSIKYALIALIAIIFFVLVFTLIIPLTYQIRLTSMGYSKTSANAIRQQNLTKEVLIRDYSHELDINLSKGIEVGDYLDLYCVSTNIDDDAIYLFNKLISHNYSFDDLVKVFKELNYQEILPLLVYNNVSNIDDYIEDVLKYRESEKYFVYDFSKYTILYDKAEEVKNPDSIEVLVNKYYKLPENYEPQLVDCSVKYAAKGIKIRKEAYDAFIDMCKAMSKENDENGNSLVNMYIIAGYRSYDYLESNYKSVYSRYAKNHADIFSSKPLYNEHQTGLAIDVTARGYESSGFINSPHYKWMKENAHKYGFIFCFEKEYCDKEHYSNSSTINTITVYPYESNHFRYVGIDLATKIYESGLLFDLYYELYLK